MPRVSAMGPCEDKCVEDLNSCTSQATEEFNNLMTACSRISDPGARAECEASAASFYATWLGACQTAYELCLDQCS